MDKQEALRRGSFVPTSTEERMPVEEGVALAPLLALRRRWGAPWNDSLARSRAARSQRDQLEAGAAQAKQDLDGRELQLEAQYSMTPPQRRWHLERVVPCVALLAALEAPAAYLSAQAFDVSLGLTLVITLLIVAALIIAAGGVVHASGR
jgi:hypothetical protein